MSPASREISGPRPAPLKIHKDSHLIHKPTTSSSSSSSTTTTTHNSQQQRHHPVIIYTHSPKVIHTQARDFMALVQKLTGLSHSPDDDDDDDDDTVHPAPPPPVIDRKDNISLLQALTGHDDSSSSSENGDFRVPMPPAAAASPLGFDSLQRNHFMQEIPLFTPNSSDFFCSPGSFYGYPESSVFSPSNPNSVSQLFGSW